MSRAARSLRLSRSRPAQSFDQAPLPIRRERVLQAIDAMAEDERLVLALQLCDGFTAEEIAEILEMSPRAVLRARDRLLIDVRRALHGVPPSARPQTAAVSLRSAV